MHTVVPAIRCSRLSDAALETFVEVIEQRLGILDRAGQQTEQEFSFLAGVLVEALRELDARNAQLRWAI